MPIVKMKCKQCGRTFGVSDKIGTPICPSVICPYCHASYDVPSVQEYVHTELERQRKEELEWVIESLNERANNGDAEAYRLLGDVYYQGLSGKEKNVKASFPYYKLAADHGDTIAAGKVGITLLTGHSGIAEDETAGLRYMKMSADAGESQSQFVVAECYLNGIGCSKDDAMAEKYYLRAALQDHAEAQYKLGLLMFVSKKIGYLHWFCCAHLHGIKDATDVLNDLINNDPDFRHTVDWQIDEIKTKGIIPEPESNDSRRSGGCYIATAVYGSYDCPEVWTLRRFRDNVLARTWYGRLFIRCYYAVSPTVVQLFGDCQWFKRFFRHKLDKMVSDLQSNSFQSTPYQDATSLF